MYFFKNKKTVKGKNFDSLAPLGSAFKLFVLQAVCDAVLNGRLQWHDKLRVRDELRTAGEGADLAGDTELDVATATQLMIQTSNNQTTDMLMAAVGRERVEAVQRRFLVTARDPICSPCLDTRSFFVLKQDVAGELTQQWLNVKDSTARRALLCQIAATPLDLTKLAKAFESPVEPMRIEWLATMRDMASLMASLFNQVKSNEKLSPAFTALTTNPGVPANDASQWRTIAFKGGSEPGVLSTVWLCESDSGEQSVCAMSIVNDTTPFDAIQPSLIAASLRDKMFLK